MVGGVAARNRDGARDVQGVGALFWMLGDRISALLADQGDDAGAIGAEVSAVCVEAVLSAASNRRVPIPHDRGQ